MFFPLEQFQHGCLLGHMTSDREIIVGAASLSIWEDREWEDWGVGGWGATKVRLEIREKAGREGGRE